MTKRKDGKRPWFALWPEHWRGDERLRMCSLEARGLWMELLCLMDRAEPRGFLRVNGHEPSPDQLASLCGCTVEGLTRGVNELERFGVVSRDAQGVLFSRRMVREAERSAAGRANGRKGGNPALTGAREVDGATQGVNPSGNPEGLDKEERGKRKDISSPSPAGAGERAHTREPPPRLDAKRCQALAGNALASMATHPGIATVGDLNRLLDGDPPCEPGDVYDAIERAAAWHMGRGGAGSMTNWKVAARIAVENRDRRLEGLPPVNGGAGDDGNSGGGPRGGRGAERAANFGRAGRGAELARRARQGPQQGD